MLPPLIEKEKPIVVNKLLSQAELDALLDEIDEMDVPYGHRVLVVDESQTLRLRLALLLEENGYKVEQAEDGFDALSKIALFHPDLVIANTALSHLDGTRLCAMVKHHPDFKHIPVILLSNQDGPFDEARYRLSGAEDVIKKPLNDELLLDKTKSLLSVAIRRL